MKNEKLRRVGRHGLIALLLVIAVILMSQTDYYAGFRENLAGHRSERLSVTASAGSQVSERPAGTAQPLAAMVNLENGGRYGASYEEESVMAVFQRFSADLGEALGSAGVPAVISEEQFRMALSDCGIFLRFYCSLPLELLASWSGAEASSSLSGCGAELLCLQVAQDRVLLYCRDAAGEYFCCETGASAERLRSRIAEYEDNGAQYVFEESLPDGDGCAVLLKGRRTARLVKCTAVQCSQEEADRLLRAVGMNSYVSSSYAETDGTRVFVSGESTLRLRPDGSLQYRNPVIPESSNPLTLTDVAAMAWQAAERSAGIGCGDGNLIFAGVSSDESQNCYTVRFDYAVDGIPVRTTSGNAVEIVLRGDKIVQARIQLSCFSEEEETATLLPDLQAFAVAAAEHASAELFYFMGSETMNCDWVKTDG